MEQNKQHIKNKSMGLIVTLFTNSGEISTLCLPAKPEGFYSFSERTDCNVLSIEGRNNQWYAFCKRPGFFRNTPPGCYCEVLLEDGQYIEVECEDKSYSLLVEEASHSKLAFINHTVHSEIDITIGSSSSNDIIYNNRLISPSHAILSRKCGNWYIKSCTNQTNIYVNKFAVSATPLALGDSLFIMGLRIIIGTNFISVNSLSEDILVSDRILQNATKRRIGYGRYSGQEPVCIHQEVFFNRLPRKCTVFNSKTVVIESPPMSTEHAQMPLMLRMGSSMVMSGKAAMTGNYTMLLTSLLFPLLSSNYSDTQRKNYESLRSTKYTEYLESKRQEILRSLKEESDFLNIKYPDLFSLIQQPDYQKHIWERRPQDNDFLTLRIGRGNRCPCTIIDYPEKHFELSTDPLEDKMYQLAEQQYILENVPITLPVTECTVLGISGNHEQKANLIHQLITQIVFFHSYDEVKLVFLIDSDELEAYEFVRFLPHVWDDQRTIRFVATNESEAYNLGEYFRNQLPDNIEAEKDLPNILKQRPYYIVFAMNKRLLNSVEILKTIMAADTNHGISVFASFEDLPKECQKIISLNSHGEHTLTSLTDINTDDVRFLPDYYASEKAFPVLQKLSNLSLKSISQEQELPKMITFLEMLQVGRVEQINPLQRWQENNPTLSLAAPVGVAADGSPFMLDLHEKFQGPHGLVAGMTGSGKSEFIITYILSMAINYHPNEVSFILIDYKGGGLADAFDNPKKGIHLPHLVGTITNLDGSSIQRSLRSLNSEVLRRQRVFKEAKAQTGESTMDIYKYQKLYRKGLLDEPMAHLFIVSDEFAELKQQKPEFMDNLISIARIGRSLGIHLILATQKPSGVVNDQIRSNSKFRVCLKVQEKTDSQDMLKRPEAAELKDTGRFYLQVGYNELFALGQSAWTGADYEPYDEVVVHKDDSIQFIDSIGQYTYEAKKKVEKQTEGKSQLNAVVELLSDAARSLNIQRKALWQPELPSDLPLAELQKQIEPVHTGSLAIPLGLVDDPETQSQFPLIYDFIHSKNLMIVGEKGTGKTTLVQSMLYSLATTYTPEQVQFYILDYSSRMLKLFRNLPHCGAVLFEENTDRLPAFFDTINNIIAERKKLFSALDVDNFETAASIKSIPLIIVIIDGLSVLGTSKIGYSHLSNLKEYLKNGTSYGIKYVITASSMGEIHTQVRLEIGDRLALRLKDKYEYIGVLNTKVEYLPPELPGRGVCVVAGKALEFHCASIFGFSDPNNIIGKIKADLEICTHQNSLYSSALQLPVLNINADYEEFASQFPNGRIPLGFSLKDSKPIALPMRQFSSLSIYFGSPDGTIPIFSNFLYAANKNRMTMHIVPRSVSSCFDPKSKRSISADLIKGASFISPSTSQLSSYWKQLMDEISQRKPVLQNYCTEHNIKMDQDDVVTKTYNYMAQKTDPILVLIENLADFSAHLDNNASLVFNRIFEIAHKLNIHIIAGIEPDDHARMSDSIVFNGYNVNGTTFLFGGEFHRQTLVNIPNHNADKQMPYNRCLMRYRNKLHALLMPCGEITSEISADPDDQDIF